MCLGDHLGGVRLDAGHIRQGQVTQKLDISSGSLHRREGQTQNLESQTLDKCHEIIQHHLMDLGIPDDALLANIVLTCLELRYLRYLYDVHNP